MNKLVSIILPVKNNEKYLSESIESVLNQSYDNIELLILDDGSKDKSLSIIEGYALQNKNIRIISRENKGVANSINEMIKYASGEYIGRMDGDDISYKNRIETQVKFLEEHQDISLVGSYVDIEITDYKNIDDVKMCEKMFNFKIDKNLPSVKFLNKNKICHGTFLGRSNLFKKINYDCKLRECEDIDIILNCISNGFKVDIISKKLYLNRVSSKFIHQHKKMDECYNKEILKIKVNFLEKYLLNKEIYVLNNCNSYKILIELLKGKSNFIKEICSCNEINNFKNAYVIILDDYEHENIENELISRGMRILNDFITL